MTSRYVLSPRAQADLDDIWNYTESGLGEEQTETYIRRVRQDIERTAMHPSLGRPCPEIRAGYYKFRSGSPYLFYRRRGDTLEVTRVLHERMDFQRHMP